MRPTQESLIRMRGVVLAIIAVLIALAYLLSRVNGG